MCYIFLFSMFISETMVYYLPGSGNARPRIGVLPVQTFGMGAGWDCSEDSGGQHRRPERTKLLPPQTGMNNIKSVL